MGTGDQWGGLHAQAQQQMPRNYYDEWQAQVRARQTLVKGILDQIGLDAIMEYVKTNYGRRDDSKGPPTGLSGPLGTAP